MAISGASNEPKTPDIRELNTAMRDSYFSRQTLSNGKSAGRLYVVIDSKTGAVGLTSDKKQASSMKTIAGIATQILRQGEASIKQRDLADFKESISGLVNLYENKKRNVFEKIIHFFDSATRSAVTILKMTSNSLQERSQEQSTKVSYDKTIPQGEKDYGKKKGVDLTTGKTIDKSVDYQKVGRKPIEPLSFEKLKSSDYLTEDDIFRTFSYELEEKGIRNSKFTPSADFVAGLAGDIISDLSTEVEKGRLSPQEAVKEFYPKLMDVIVARNQKIDPDADEKEVIGDSLMEKLQGILPSLVNGIKSEEGSLVSPLKETLSNYFSQIAPLQSEGSSVNEKVGEEEKKVWRHGVRLGAP